MVTAYTKKLYDGDPITFPEFAMRCARDFSVLMVMRDAPLGAEIPTQFPPNLYYAECLHEARQALARVESYSLEDAERFAEQEYEAAVAERAEDERQRTALRNRYEAMLAHVRAWKPPTPDHQGLQDFMIRQLEEGIEFDCGDAPDDVARLSAKEWLDTAIHKAKFEIAYYEKKDANERRAARERTEWVQQLRQSLLRAEENPPMSLRDNYKDAKDRACHECGKEVPLADILSGEAAIQLFTGRVFHWDCWFVYQRNEGL